MYLYGASGHGMVIIEILELNDIHVEGIFDDHPSDTQLLGYPVIGAFDRGRLGDEEMIISIGSNKVRKLIAEREIVRYGRALHWAANISKRAVIGEGTVVMAGVSVNAAAIIGTHVILNTNCSVDHECVIGNFVHI